MDIPGLGSLFYILIILTVVLFAAVDIQINAKHIPSWSRVLWSLIGVFPIGGLLLYAVLGRGIVKRQERRATHKPKGKKALMPVEKSRRSAAKEEQDNPDFVDKLLFAFAIIIVIGLIGFAIVMFSFAQEWGAR